MERISPNLISHSHVSAEEAVVLANHFYDKGRTITDKPCFRNMGDLNKIELVFLTGALCYRQFTLPTPETDETIIHLVGFRYAVTQELKGYMLYTVGYPWWSSTCKGASELAVMSIQEGCGIGRKAAEYLKSLVKYNLVDVVETGTAISKNNHINNSYKRAGFTKSNSFMYMKE